MNAPSTLNFFENSNANPGELQLMYILSNIYVTISNLALMNKKTFTSSIPYSERQPIMVEEDFQCPTCGNIGKCDFFTCAMISKISLENCSFALAESKSCVYPENWQEIFATMEHNAIVHRSEPEYDYYRYSYYGRNPEKQSNQNCFSTRFEEEISPITVSENQQESIVDEQIANLVVQLSLQYLPELLRLRLRDSTLRGEIIRWLSIIWIIIPIQALSILLLLQCLLCALQQQNHQEHHQQEKHHQHTQTITSTTTTCTTRAANAAVAAAAVGYVVSATFGVCA